MSQNDELFPNVPLYVVDTGAGITPIKWHEAKTDEQAWRFMESVELNVTGAKLYKLRRLEIERPAKR